MKRKGYRHILKRAGIHSAGGGVDFSRTFVWALADTWNQVQVTRELQKAA